MVKGMAWLMRCTPSSSRALSNSAGMIIYHCVNGNGLIESRAVHEAQVGMLEVPPVTLSGHHCLEVWQDSTIAWSSLPFPHQWWVPRGPHIGPDFTEASYFAEHVHLLNALLTYLGGCLVISIMGGKERVATEVVGDHQEELPTVSSGAEFICRVWWVLLINIKLPVGCILSILSIVIIIRISIDIRFILWKFA